MNDHEWAVLLSSLSRRKLCLRLIFVLSWRNNFPFSILVWSMTLLTFDNRNICSLFPSLSSSFSSNFWFWKEKVVFLPYFLLRAEGTIPFRIFRYERSILSIIEFYFMLKVSMEEWLICLLLFLSRDWLDLDPSLEIDVGFSWGRLNSASLLYYIIEFFFVISSML